MVCAIRRSSGTLHSPGTGTRQAWGCGRLRHVLPGPEALSLPFAANSLCAAALEPLLLFLLKHRPWRRGLRPGVCADSLDPPSAESLSSQHNSRRICMHCSF